MAKRVCPVCGLELAVHTATCPCCKNALPPRATPLLNPAEEQALLYSYMMPALEDLKQLAACKGSVIRRLKEYESIIGFSEAQLLQNAINNTFYASNESLKATQAHNSKVLMQAFSNFGTNMTSSNYNGLGFSVITDGAGAVAYAAVDAMERHVHDVTRTRNAYSKMISDMQSLTTSSSNSTYVNPILRTIDQVAYLIDIMLDKKAFLAECPDFYSTNKDYATKVCGLRLQWEISPSPKPYMDSEREAYFALAAAGYIAVCERAHKYITTCKYEAETIRARYRKEHPQEVAAYEAAVNKELCKLAQQSLDNNDYYRAAVRFGKTVNNRDALRKSIAIWNEYLQHMPPVSDGYALGANGDCVHLYLGSNYSHLPSFDPFRQIIPCAERQAAALTFDGRIQCNVKNLYGDEKEKNDLPGNGSNWTGVTAIASSRNHLVALLHNGTVRAVGKNDKGQCNVDSWCNVVQVQTYGKSTAALTADGTVLLAGAVKGHASAYESWKDIKEIYLQDNSAVVALTKNGQVLADGEPSFDKDALKKWHNVVRICWFNDSIFGITDAGDVLCDGSSETIQQLCSHLKGVVKVACFHDQTYACKVSQFAALMADGTVFTVGIPLNTNDWKDIVDIDCNRTPFSSDVSIFAVTADGTPLMKGSNFLSSVEEWKPFDHINNYKKIQRQTIERMISEKKEQLLKAKGLFAGKQRKELQQAIDHLQKALDP